MASPTPFRISIPETRILRLKQKLSLTDFPSEVVDAADPWARGSPLAEIKRLAQYWETRFEWRKAEAGLNEFPQYVSPIEVDGFGTYDVHFIHQPSNVQHAIPLLYIHGWPGSFVEVTKILPLLVVGGKDLPAFHVVAPSLIDFGFSSASKKDGFGIDQHAEACHKLMLSLGYNEYIIQSGDVGYLVARRMASEYGPKHCKAYHLSNAAPAEPTETSHPELYAKVQATPLTPGELAGLGRSTWFSREGAGYSKQLSTKPQTIAYSLADSPVGLLAWIYEKLHDWTDGYAWTEDEILTWVSIYYFSKAGPAATSYLYYEMEHKESGAFAAAQMYSDVPLGVARFPKDLILLPKLWSHTLGPIVFESEHASGGHFAAWECPDAIAADLRIMFGRGGGAAGSVKGGVGM